VKHQLAEQAVTSVGQRGLNTLQQSCLWSPWGNKVGMAMPARFNDW